VGRWNSGRRDDILFYPFTKMAIKLAVIVTEAYHCYWLIQNCIQHFPLKINHPYLTNWSTILLQKLTVALIVKKFTTCYRTWRFITVLTRAHQWPWASRPVCM
jgi:hypothetical protein